MAAKFSVLLMQIIKSFYVLLDIIPYISRFIVNLSLCNTEEFLYIYF